MKMLLAEFLYMLLLDKESAGYVERLIDRAEGMAADSTVKPIYASLHAYAEDLAERISPAPTKIYVVGKIASDEKHKEWQLVGVFLVEADAIEACRTEDHFIATVPPCADFGDDPEPFPDASYPKREWA